MDFRPERLDPPVARIEATLTDWLGTLPPGRRPVVERWLGDAAALRFHLREGRASGRRGGGAAGRPTIVALFGGTGAGKSTLVNRLVGTPLTAASFRRTFTAGPVAIVGKPEDLPPQWLGWEHHVASADELPVRGRDRTLIVVSRAMGAPGSGAGGTAALVRETASGGGASTGGGAPTDGGALPGSRSLAVSPGSAAPTTAPAPETPNPPTIVDTPDLDGDTPLHHAVADRVFRWAEAVVFAVTPEKYQMTELPPYYRLAKRYAVPTLFVMNKCEEAVVAEDYERQLVAGGFVAEGEGGIGGGGEGGDVLPPRVFVVPRDDSGYEPPARQNLAQFRAAVARAEPGERSVEGLRNRAADVLGRLTDQVIQPLADDRREADRLIAALRGMEAPTVGVNVNPITQQLQRRLQQRSILYLIGPQRVLDRVRQAPSLLARLPRTAWDWFRTGELSPDLLKANAAGGGRPDQAPDFRAALTDQFALVQSRIDDVVRGSPIATRWIDARPPGEPAASSYAAARLDPGAAGRIADEELAELKAWLERRWNANPRDTRMVERLLKALPGGKKLVQWTESAPYLLTIVLVAHGAVFGHLDLLIIGGYSLAAWIGEKLSNEVTGRARQANAQIEQRFAALASDQIRRVCDWLDLQAPSARSIEALEAQARQAAELLEE